MSKRDALLDFESRAKFTPTLAISINPHIPEHRALIEAGFAQRQVIWLRTWNNVLDWCHTQMKDSLMQRRCRLNLPSWEKPPLLREGWWASGLFTSCQSFLSSGDFDLSTIVLPGVLQEAPVGLFSNTSKIKPTWCISNDILALCESAGVKKWSQYVRPEKRQEIISKASALCHVLVRNLIISEYPKMILTSKLQPRLEFFQPEDGNMDPLIPSILHDLPELGFCKSPFHPDATSKIPKIFLVEIKVGGAKYHKCHWCYSCWSVLRITPH